MIKRGNIAFTEKDIDQAIKSDDVELLAKIVPWLMDRMKRDAALLGRIKQHCDGNRKPSNRIVR